MKYQYNFTLIIFIKNVISNETEVEEFVRSHTDSNLPCNEIIKLKRSKEIRKH